LEGGTEGSHTTVSKGTEFSQKQHRILGLVIKNSVPQGTELRWGAQESRPSRWGKIGRLLGDRSIHVAIFEIEEAYLFV
jgi:hypothetical protein